MNTKSAPTVSDQTINNVKRCNKRMDVEQHYVPQKYNKNAIAECCQIIILNDAKSTQALQKQLSDTGGNVQQTNERCKTMYVNENVANLQLLISSRILIACWHKMNQITIVHKHKINERCQKNLLTKLERCNNWCGVTNVTCQRKCYKIVIAEIWSTNNRARKQNRL